MFVGRIEGKLLETSFRMWYNSHIRAGNEALNVILPLIITEKAGENMKYYLFCTMHFKSGGDAGQYQKGGYTQLHYAKKKAAAELKIMEFIARTSKEISKATVEVIGIDDFGNKKVFDTRSSGFED